MLNFEQADDFFNGNPQIQMVYSGFEIPAIEAHPELALFNVSTFGIFRKQRSIEMCYGPVNFILDALPLDKQKIIAQALTLCNAYIKDEEHQDPEEAVTYCAKILDSMELETNICDDMDRYTRDYVYIPDMSDAGTHPQDREDLTFCREEAIIAVALFILMKLMNPIIGQYLHKFGVVLGNKYKERMAVSMFTAIFDRKYRTLIEKLLHYTERLVYNKLKDDTNMHYRGYTVASVTALAADTLLTKKAASIDLTRDDSFIVKFIASCIKSFVESLQKSSKDSLIVKIFDNPKESEASSVVEESNSSRMETESKPSRKPADSVTLAHNAARVILLETIEEFGLDRDFITSILMWYKQNPVVTSIISTYILSCYYGSKMNGKSVLLLNNIASIKLAAVLQVIAMRDRCPNLTHALTMSITMEDRMSTQADFKFMNAWKSSPEYGACKKTITNQMGLTIWDTQLKNIASQLSQKNFIYHTAPQIYELTNAENMNGRRFDNNYELMVELLAFTLEIWQKNTIKKEE